MPPLIEENCETEFPVQDFPQHGLSLFSNMFSEFNLNEMPLSEPSEINCIATPFVHSTALSETNLFSDIQPDPSAAHTVLANARADAEKNSVTKGVNALLHRSKSLHAN